LTATLTATPANQDGSKVTAADPGQAIVSLRQTRLGDILVDAEGRTLYLSRATTTSGTFSTQKETRSPRRLPSFTRTAERGGLTPPYEMRRPCRRSPSLVRCCAQQLALGVRFDSNADSNADELWRTLANDYELLTTAVNFKMNAGEP